MYVYLHSIVKFNTWETSNLSKCESARQYSHLQTANICQGFKHQVTRNWLHKRAAWYYNLRDGRMVLHLRTAKEGRMVLQVTRWPDGTALERFKTRGGRMALSAQAYRVFGIPHSKLVSCMSHHHANMFCIYIYIYMYIWRPARPNYILRRATCWVLHCRVPKHRNGFLDLQSKFASCVFEFLALGLDLRVEP